MQGRHVMQAISPIGREHQVSVESSSMLHHLVQLHYIVVLQHQELLKGFAGGEKCFTLLAQPHAFFSNNAWDSFNHAAVVSAECMSTISAVVTASNTELEVAFVTVISVVPSGFFFPEGAVFHLITSKSGIGLVGSLTQPVRTRKTSVCRTYMTREEKLAIFH